MTAPDEMTVYKHRDCDNHVAYQNIPISRPDVDRSDGRRWEPINYTRTDIHQAALDRIEELEGALKDLADGAMDYSPLTGRSVETRISRDARAVLAKGDG